MKSPILMVVAALTVAVAVILTVGINPLRGTASAQSADSDSASTNNSTSATQINELQIATLAGGCFWCVESTFEKLDGVEKAVSGYAGGHTDNPTYYDVGAGNTGHTETVQIHYDPAVISYAALLHYFWREIDPTDSDGQFVDRGSMYRPAVFYHDDIQKAEIEKSLEQLRAENRFGKELKIEVLPFEKFWKAEGHHQDYYKKSPLRYKVYRHGSGRDQFLQKVWGKDLHTHYPQPANTSSSDAGVKPFSEDFLKPDDDKLRQMLSDIQYQVTQHEGTERPFSNKYWNTKDDGIYVDIVSGEPLFSSKDKFRSGTGWPSFTRPIDKKFITTAIDFKLGLPRTEVRSKFADSHLGHVFKDGPAPTGLRYCVNSASLRFIEKDSLEQEGYGKYANIFDL